ncbi:hypothetical protein SAMN02745163_01867 [Clostridium cavendishii DSM 21758]|uniref:Amidohydrolase-related domain-containing protein n=1 Tax=Clostridium cavendishii DSM 21758 TaxID=1121302 RepID=A0A1M6IZP1_9CLOT|nr:amidohydrolase family protein [Clostridium cavendishii]SHJ39914.1 hypothetical protein SAMN02745163_01867 [Clostridium cavendishii DSM 21758]
MIIDAHAHITAKNYGSVEALIERYDEIGISKGVLVPGGMIDVRMMDKVVSGEKPIATKPIPNYLVKDAMNKYPDRVFGFFCVDPNDGEVSINEFTDAVKTQGFCGLKLAPIVHRFSLKSNIVKELARTCSELEVPCFFHTTDFEGSFTKDCHDLIKDCPNTKFILGHMGFGFSDSLSIEYAKKFENLYLETSCASTSIVRQAIQTLGDTKVIFGSEYPMDDPFYALSKITCLKLSEKSFENVTCNNILNLLQKRG